MIDLLYPNVTKVEDVSENPWPAYAKASAWQATQVEVPAPGGEMRYPRLSHRGNNMDAFDLALKTWSSPALGGAEKENGVTSWIVNWEKGSTEKMGGPCWNNLSTADMIRHDNM